MPGWNKFVSPLGEMHRSLPIYMFYGGNKSVRDQNV